MPRIGSVIQHIFISTEHTRAHTGWVYMVLVLFRPHLTFPEAVRRIVIVGVSGEYNAMDRGFETDRHAWGVKKVQLRDIREIV